MPDQIVEQTFSTTRFRAGYDADQVDLWLDEVVTTMRGHISGSLGVAPIRAEDVAAVRFTQTRFRDGYDMAEVDELLDRVQATLAALERGERPR